jgi:hypothetical protein
MLPFTPGKLGEDKQCPWCHGTVALTHGTQSAEGSNNSLRKHVDVNLCALCHGPDSSGPQFYRIGIATTTDGAALYDLACAGCHRDLANSEVKGESLGEIQKAIAENEGGMGPLSALSTEIIQKIAAALAQAGGED